ncbi:Protein FAR1-RELATED SEQUENCE 2, partial [Linum perenne]
MPANQEVSDIAKDSLRHARQTGLKQHEAYNLEVHKHGGHAYVGYTKKYAFNQCHRDDLETLSVGDVVTALAYLKSKSNYDDKFFMEYTVTEDYMLKKDLREEEIRLDYQSNHCAPELTSTIMRSVEKSASMIYTLEAFKKIKIELQSCTSWSTNSLETVGNFHIYNVKLYDPNITTTMNITTTTNITYDVGTKSADCVCTKFKSLAIPCQHMLAILKEENVFEIPESYVHKRFTKQPKDYAQLNRPNLGDEATQLAQRYGAIQFSTQELSKLGVVSAEACKAVLSSIKEVVERVRAIDQNPTTTSKIIIPEEIQ